MQQECIFSAENPEAQGDCTLYYLWVLNIEYFHVNWIQHLSSNKVHVVFWKFNLGKFWYLLLTDNLSVYYSVHTLINRAINLIAAVLIGFHIYQEPPTIIYSGVL